MQSQFFTESPVMDYSQCLPSFCQGVLGSVPGLGTQIVMALSGFQPRRLEHMAVDTTAVLGFV